VFTVRPTANGETVQTMYGESPRNLHEAEIGSRSGVHPTAVNWGLPPVQPASIEYKECGSGPTVVLVPGSCSTGAAWRSVVSHLGDGFRCVTTSLLGYGETGERRTTADASIDHECRVVEEVIERAGGRVHLVGHSFGGLVALAVALRGRAPLASLTIFEAPAVGLLRGEGDGHHYRDFRNLTDGYFSAYRGGNREAIAAMIDFYGGPGTYASWPERVRSHAVETTPVNMLDWAGAYAFTPSHIALSALSVPTQIAVGAMSHPAVRRANESVVQCLPDAVLWEIEGASHFMTATHPQQVAKIISGCVDDADRSAIAGGKAKISRG
jgi:pimeloyl-ACP methyl ester carboxylesterase